MRGTRPSASAAAGRARVTARRTAGFKGGIPALRGRGAGHFAGDVADLLVAELLLVIAHRDEALVDDVHLRSGQVEAEVLAAIGQGVAAAVLAEHEAALRHAHRLRLDDLVGRALLEEAVLVDAGLVSEGVLAD